MFVLINSPTNSYFMSQFYTTAFISSQKFKIRSAAVTIKLSHSSTYILSFGSCQRKLRIYIKYNIYKIEFGRAIIFIMMNVYTIMMFYTFLLANDLSTNNFQFLHGYSHFVSLVTVGIFCCNCDRFQKVVSKFSVSLIYFESF